MSNRASETSTQIGADLLSQPPPVNRNLGHLVGRTLVPFFMASGEENATHDLAHNEQIDFGVDNGGDATEVRTFVDGYFVTSGTLAPKQQQPPQQATKPSKHKQPSPSPPPPVAAQASPTLTAAQPQRKAKKNYAAAAASASAATLAAPPSAPAAAPAAPSRLYAGAAFLASPAPQAIPLPKFLQTAVASTPAASEPTKGSKKEKRRAAPVAPPAPVAPAAVISAATPPPAAAPIALTGHPHPATDAHASASLMSLLRGGPAAAATAALPHAPIAAAPILHMAQPTLLAPTQSVPNLPATYPLPPAASAYPHPHSHPHAHPHAPAYGAAYSHPHAPPAQAAAYPAYHPSQPSTSYAAPSYYNVAPPAPSATTATGAAPIPLPSAVYDRYDRRTPHHAAAPTYGYQPLTSYQPAPSMYPPHTTFQPVHRY